MYPSEKVRIVPLLSIISSKATGDDNAKVRYRGQGDFSVLVGVRCGTVMTGSTDVTATAAANYDFSVIEATAATVTGSVISGAAITLGASAAFTMKGGVNCMLQVTTNCGTADGVTLNGITYHGTAVGSGTSASAGSVKIARAINGYGTSNKLPHYTAHSLYTAKDLCLIAADDDLGTGITASCTANSGIQIFMSHLQGVIDVQGSKLSTHSPKYIGVGCTALTGLATGAKYAIMISHPTGRPGTPGVKVSCTT